jgi:glycerate kinase
MKILIAPDSFKGALTAVNAAGVMAEALVGKYPHAECVICPMADGGEGTASLLCEHWQGQWVEQEVMGPLPDRRVYAGFAWFADRALAVIDMASCCGLPLLSPQEQNPWRTTTYGVGELLQSAVALGAKQVWLGVGGSATIDLGLGAAMALGARCESASGQAIALGGQGLMQLVKLKSCRLPFHLTLLTDVTNPLLGETGAVAVFGRQKGLAAVEQQAYVEAVAKAADCLSLYRGAACGQEVASGAGGGMSVGLATLCQATQVSGAEKMMKALAVGKQLASVDWLITGEGCFDAQSLYGKVTGSLISKAKSMGVKVAVFAGKVALSAEQYRAAGVDLAVQISRDDFSLQQNMQASAALLMQAIKASLRFE